jgi:hypothetical protein
METGKVTIQFLTVSDPSQVVVGVENADGTEATQYAYDDPVLIADDVAVDFYPAFGTPPPTGDLGDIEGIVTDLDTGDPIHGATVNALAFSGGEVFTFTTDATGFYSGTLCADWYSMTASAAGYRPSAEVQTAVYSGTLTVQDFELELGEADLYVNATGTATATAGALLTYTLDYGSLGPDTAPYTEVGIGLSPWVEYVSSSGGSYDDVEHWWTWGHFDTTSGFSNTATVVVRVTDTITPGETISSNGGYQAFGDNAPTDPDESNNFFEIPTFIELEEVYYHIYLPIVVRGAP